jgi:hypothetical protein
MVVTPATFVFVFELSRLGTVGPTVDRIELGAFLGIVAFVVGRVMHGVLVIGPMMLGTVYGVALATHLAADAAPRRGRVRSTLIAVVSVAVVGLVFTLARSPAQRRAGAAFVLLLALLAFFATVMDLVHLAFIKSFRGSRLVLELLEEGGEMATLSSALLLALALTRQAPPATAAARSLIPGYRSKTTG